MHLLYILRQHLSLLLFLFYPRNDGVELNWRNTRKDEEDSANGEKSELRWMIARIGDKVIAFSSK